MKKGYADLAVAALMTFLIGLFVIAIFSPLIQGEVLGHPYPSEEINVKSFCTTDTDCEINYNGSLCIRIYHKNEPPFCGCVNNYDCQTTTKVVRSGVCGTNEKCTYESLIRFDGNDCCPGVHISAPDSVDIGVVFTVDIKYNHSKGTTGTAHLHWEGTQAEYVSVAGGNYLGNYDGYNVVECDLLSDSSCSVDLRPLVIANIVLYYRGWDSSEDAICGDDKFDYDRYPSPGTCSINCGTFPDDIISCNTNRFIIEKT